MPLIRDSDIALQSGVSQATERSLLPRRLMAAFAFLLEIGAIESHAYVSVLVLAMAVAVALVDARYWFTRTFTRRVLAFVFFLLLAAALGEVHWSVGA